MQIEVTEEDNNTVLNRRELKVKVLHPAGTPSRIDVKDAVAAKYKVSPGLVIVNNMKTAFGKKETAAYVKVYDSEEAARQVERDHILKRNEPQVSEPAEEQVSEPAEEGDKGGEQDQSE